MIGLVLWYNPKAHVGMVWCEDQGPLAFLGPEASLPGGLGALTCGDQLTFSVEMRDDVRFVRDVFAVAPGAAGADPAAIVAGYHREAEAQKHLNVVA
jgi:hypothetical protein